ncbi:MAG: ABC transporter ATP-binding protein [Elusimicrobiales bacterium]|nr:ABC transporter ATP-binding protein [Elusimicrobiales bacterium]
MLKKFYLLVEECKYAMLAVWASFVVITMLRAFVNAFVYKILFDEAIAKQNIRLFVIVVVGYAIFHIVDCYFKIQYPVALKKGKNRIIKSYLGKSMAAFYKLPYPEATKEEPGYYTGRVYDEVNTASTNAVDMFAVDYTSGPIYLSISLGIALYISWKITVFAGIAVPFFVWISKKYSARIKKSASDEQENESRITGIVTLAAKAYKTVRIFALGGTSVNKTMDAVGMYNKAILDRETYINKQSYYGILSMELNEHLVLVLCGYFMLKGEMTAGDFMAYTAAFWGMFDCGARLLSNIPKYPKTKAQVDRIFSFLGISDNSAKSENTVSDGLAFENVSFSFGDKKIIENLSFDVRRGEKLLLEGRNGTGKSTIANIACGFLKPGKGNVSTEKLGDISACISPHIFIPGTLADNLNYENLTPQARKYADSLLEKFGLSEKLQSRPDDMSAGQKKKAEVIMGLLKEAKLYIFDEPLANVDEAGKADIMEEIAARTKNAALLAIIHGDEQYYGMFSKHHELGKQ